ncbi:hypothetical protein D3C85_594810 [compost metagenome]
MRLEQPGTGLQGAIEQRRRQAERFYPLGIARRWQVQFGDDIVVVTPQSFDALERWTVLVTGQPIALIQLCAVQVPAAAGNQLLQVLLPGTVLALADRSLAKHRVRRLGIDAAQLQGAAAALSLDFNIQSPFGPCQGDRLQPGQLAQTDSRARVTGRSAEASGRDKHFDGGRRRQQLFTVDPMLIEEKLRPVEATAEALSADA